MPHFVHDDTNQIHRPWAEELLGSRSDIDARTIEEFLAAMWRDDFVVSVGEDVVAACPVPLLVLPGIDDYHPTAAGREIAALAPHAELLEPWKDTPERATDAVRRFLLVHAGQ